MQAHAFGPADMAPADIKVPQQQKAKKNYSSLHVEKDAVAASLCMHA